MRLLRRLVLKVRHELADELISYTDFTEYDLFVQLVLRGYKRSLEESQIIWRSLESL
jgi:hypothetical protein